jgi:beta-galactosidase
VRYGDVAHDLHAVLRRAGVTADVVPVSDEVDGGIPDLTGYKLVLVPTLYLTSDATAAAVAAASDAGAHVLVTFFSGIVDEHDHVRLGGYPGAFRDLLGVRSEEFYPLEQGQSVTVGGLGAAASGTHWTELLSCTDAEPVATYADGPLPGVPAVTRRATGDSAAWYVATRLDAAALEELLRRVTEEAGVGPAADVPPGVEVVRRRSEAGTWLFVLNHTDDEITVDVTGHDLVADAPVGPLRLAAGRSAVVREG